MELNLLKLGSQSAKADPLKMFKTVLTGNFPSVVISIGDLSGEKQQNKWFHFYFSDAVQFYTILAIATWRRRSWSAGASFAQSPDWLPCRPSIADSSCESAPGTSVVLKLSQIPKYSHKNIPPLLSAEFTLKINYSEIQNLNNSAKIKMTFFVI